MTNKNNDQNRRFDININEDGHLEHQFQLTFYDWLLGQEILDAIDHSDHVTFENKSNIQVHVESGYIVLLGNVFREEDKAAISDIVLALGIKNIVNQLDVMEDN